MESKDAGPWRLFSRALGATFSLTCCLIAAFGLVAHELGNRAIDAIFPGTPSIPAVAADLNAVDRWMVGHAEDPIAWVRAAGRLAVEPPRAWFAPFRSAFDRNRPWREALHGTLAGAWGLVVWSILGAAIARRTLVRLTGSPGGTGLNAVLGHAGRRAGSLSIATITPILAFGVLALGMAALGVLLRLAGPWPAGLLGFVPTLIGLVLALLVLIATGAWPLMVTAVAAENEDGFDAYSRAVAYSFQGAIAYVVHLATALVVGIVGVSAVAGFVRLAFQLEGWGLSIGSNATAASAIDSMPIWPGLVRMLALGFVFAYPWTAWPVIYLKLRQRIDGADWDDIAVDEA